VDIELFHTPKTRSLRVRWLLEELGLPYRLRAVDLFGGERNPAHPLGSVPALRVNGETLIESGAICHWLTDRFPGQGLAPAPAAAARSRYEQWMFFVPGTLEPPAFDILLHSEILPPARRVGAILPFARKRYHAVLKVLAAELAQRDYLLGPQFTTADIMAGSTLMWLPDMLQNHPELQAYSDRLGARPAWLRAAAP
jgi:glutathione S-transferase